MSSRSPTERRPGPQSAAISTRRVLCWRAARSSYSATPLNGWGRDESWVRPLSFLVPNEPVQSRKHLEVLGSASSLFGTNHILDIGDHDLDRFHLHEMGGAAAVARVSGSS